MTKGLDGPLSPTVPNWTTTGFQWWTGLGQRTEFDDDWISMEDRLGRRVGSDDAANSMMTGFLWMIGLMKASDCQWAADSDPSQLPRQATGRAAVTNDYSQRSIRVSRTFEFDDNCIPINYRLGCRPGPEFDDDWILMDDRMDRDRLGRRP